jgi:hypothetical protein
MYVTAVEENKTYATRQQDRSYDQSDYNQDPKKYRQLRDAEARSARNDQKKVSQNAVLQNRIQGTFGKIRSELMQVGLYYSWFKQLPYGYGYGY